MFIKQIEIHTKNIIFFDMYITIRIIVFLYSFNVSDDIRRCRNNSILEDVFDGLNK
jgi:hypothetical protein